MTKKNSQFRKAAQEFLYQNVALNSWSMYVATCTSTFFISYFPAIFSKPTVCYSFVKIYWLNHYSWLTCNALVSLQKRGVIHTMYIIANLTIFNTILRAISMHFLCQIPLILMYVHSSNSTVQKWPLR